MRETFCRLCLVLALTLSPATTHAARPGGDVEYVGGTVAEVPQNSRGRLLTTHPRYLFVQMKGATIRIPFDRINLLEYGQKVSRRYLMAVLISPVLIMAKTRRHYLSLGYMDEDSNQQALVFAVDKDDIRAVLVSLEARTGLKIEYQDDEARKAGKG